MEMPMSDVNDLDEVVCELEIEDSDMSPAEAVREMKSEIVTLRAELDGAIRFGKVWQDRVHVADGEIASLRAGQERIRDEAFQLGRQESWEQAQETIKRLQAELSTWQHVYLHLRSLLGVDRGDMTDPQLWQATETALRKVLAAARQDAEEPTKYMLWAEIRLRDGKIRQDAEENARLKEALKWYATAVVSNIHPDSPGRCDDGGCARAALACCPQGEKS